MDYDQLQRLLQSRPLPVDTLWDEWVANCQPRPDDEFIKGVRQDIKHLWDEGRYIQIPLSLLEQLPELWMQKSALLLGVRLLLDAVDGRELQVAPYSYPYLEALQQDLVDGTNLTSTMRSLFFITVDIEEARRQPEPWTDYLQTYHPNADLTDLDVLEALEAHTHELIGDQLVPGRGARRVITQALAVINEPDSLLSAEYANDENPAIDYAAYQLAYSYAETMAKRYMYIGGWHLPNGPLWQATRDREIQNFFVNWWTLVVCKFPWVQKKMVLYHGTTISNLRSIEERGLMGGAAEYGPEIYLGQLPLAYYYAAAQAHNSGEDRGVVLQISIPFSAVPRLQLRSDTTSLTEPVGFYQIERQETLDQLDHMELLTEDLEKEADEADQLVETEADEETFWQYLEQNGWPSPEEWERSLVLVGSVYTLHPIPPEWISVYDDNVEPTPLVPH